MRNFLLISYHFPPLGGSGVQRALKLAKYLPDSDWHAHVICAAHQHYPVSDASLRDEIGPEASVYPTLGWDAGSLAARFGRQLGLVWKNREATHAWENRLYWRLERWQGRLPLPEQELSWIPSAIARAREVARRFPIDAVVTTSPPNVSHYIGRHLKRRLGMPWIADLRDPIVDNFAGDPHAGLEQRFRRSIERMILHGADRVVVTCPELGDRLHERYADLPDTKIRMIPNGYDAADVQLVAAEPADRDRFTMTYVGAFYRQQTIAPILDGLRLLRRERPDAAEKLRFRIVGTMSAPQRALLKDDDAAYIEVVGYRPHAEAIGEMSAADALVLTTPANEGGRYCIPAKTFEYFAFGRHIVAGVHRGTAVEDWLRRAGDCTIVAEPTAQAWKAAIEKAFDAWLTETSEKPRDKAFVESFRRDRLAAQFAELLDDCVDGRPRLKISRPSDAEEAAA